MSGSNDAGRSWQRAASSHSRFSREWRPAGTSAGNAFATGRGLKFQRAALAGLTLAIAALIVWFLFQIFVHTVPPARVVAIGVSVYPDAAFPPNAYGHEDARSFLQLHEQNPKQFPSQDVVWENLLDGDVLLSQIGEELRDLEGKNLVVFCSLHGFVKSESEGRAASAQLFAIDAEADSAYTENARHLVPVRELVRKLEETPAQRILLLLDASRIDANWRLGILANDFAAQLAAELDEEIGPNSRLQVICAAGPNEASWTSADYSGGRSVFAEHAVNGLLREADGWGVDEGGAAGPDHHNADSRVTASELYAYVKYQVAEWARKNRGVPQTVWRFPAEAPDFELVQIRKPPAPDDVAVAAADAETEPPSDESQPPADATKEANEAAEKDAGGEAKAKAPATDGAGDSPDGKKADPEKPSDGADSADTKAAVADTNSANAAESDTPPEFTLEVLNRRLGELWNRRDELRRQGAAVVNSPREWRSLQVFLVRSEQLLRIGAVADAAPSLDECQRLLDVISTRSDAGGLYPENSAWSTLSLALADRVQAPGLDEKGHAEFDGLLKTALAATPEMPEPLQKFQQFVEAKPEAERALARYLVDQFRGVETLGREGVQKLRSFIAMIPPERQPAEILACRQLLHLADLSASGRLEWTPAFASDCATAFELALQIERLTAGDPVLTPYIRPEIDAVLKAQSAAVRWLEVGGGREGQARQWLATANRHLKRADETAEIVHNALHLRARLLAELPDFARWTADRAEADPNRAALTGRMQALARYFQDPQSGSFQNAAGALPDEHERLLLELMRDARHLNELLARSASGASTSSQDTLSQELSRATVDIGRRWESYQKTFQLELDLLGSMDAVTADTWRRIDQILEVPWITASQRLRLLGKLAVTPERGLLRTADPLQDVALTGGWQGFWAIQALALAGRDVGPLWDQWAEFVSQTSADAARFAAASLGRSVNVSWWEIANALEQPSRSRELVRAEMAQRELLARCVDGTDRPAKQDRGAVLRLRDLRLQELLCLRRSHAFDSSRRPGRTELHADVEQFAKRIESAIEAVDPRFECPSRPADVPRLSDLAEVVKFDLGSRRQTELPIRIAPSPSYSSVNDQPIEVKLRLEGPGVSVRIAGEVVSEDAFSIAGEPLVRRYQLGLDPRTGSDSRLLTVALLRTSDGRPLEIRQIVLQPPIDPNQWRIVFLHSSEVAGNARWNEVVRNRPLQGATELSLPPTPAGAEASYPLQAFLVRPENDSIASAAVSVFVRDAKGQTKRLFELPDVKLEASGKPTLLPFSEPPPAAPAQPPQTPPAGNGAAPVPPPSTALDVSHGLVFEITPKGRQTIVHQVRPTLYPANRLVTIGQGRTGALPVFQDLNLSVLVQRVSPVDPLLPEAVPVELELPQAMAELPGNKDLTEPALAIGPPRELSVRFHEQVRGVLDRREYEVALSVGGLPHAFRWDVRHQLAARPKTGNVPWVKIAGPRNGQVFKQGDALPVRLQVDSTQLDLVGANEPWRLRYELVRKGGLAGGGQTNDWTLYSSLDKTISLRGVKGGVWEFATSVADWNDQIATTGRSGHFELHAKLFPNGGTVALAQDTIEIAIDSEQSPPAQPRFLGAPREFLVNGRALRVAAQVEDAESGISEVTAGIDLNGDNALAKDEILVQETYRNPIEQTRRQIVIVVPPEIMPEKESEHAILVTAKNGLGVAPPDPGKHVVRFKYPPKIGTLVVRLKNLGIRQPTITLTGPAPSKQSRTLNRNDQIRVPGLLAGEYEVEVKWRKAKVEKVVVQPNESTTVTVDVSLLE